MSVCLASFLQLTFFASFAVLVRHTLRRTPSFSKRVRLLVAGQVLATGMDPSYMAEGRPAASTKGRGLDPGSGVFAQCSHQDEQSLVSLPLTDVPWLPPSSVVYPEG
ncbi:hypothetical protein NW759_013550 [Fusarium solani]|jgi:hypothetical protein|nr:hypothetical protein NW759_013550 [Fusarium solani]